MVKIEILKLKTKVCSACKKRKKITEFGKNKNQKDGLQYCCKKCKYFRMQKYLKSEGGKRIRKVWRKKYRNSLKYKESRKRRYNSLEFKAKQKIRQRSIFKELKQEVINSYGGKCECCGETILDFLTIDHINGGGKAHRLKIGVWGYPGKFYKYLKENNFPQDPPLRVLCMNCNWVTRNGNICPHKRKI